MEKNWPLHYAVVNCVNTFFGTIILLVFFIWFHLMLSIFCALVFQKEKERYQSIDGFTLRNFDHVILDQHLNVSMGFEIICKSTQEANRRHNLKYFEIPCIITC